MTMAILTVPHKGAWRDLALSYKLAANNTNAGYLLKTIYYKNLACVRSPRL
jgi:hypothetical protein